jgi:DNA-directed RNA polymerase specialized sigma24 family protein
MAGKDESPSSDPALLGVLALLAADRAEREPQPEVPTEVLLGHAGLSYQVIADVLGKKPEAVRKRIERAKIAAKPKSKAGKGAKVKGGKD